jgi:hypothetical protein
MGKTPAHQGKKELCKATIMGPKKENEMKKSRELVHKILQLKQGKS